MECFTSEEGATEVKVGGAGRDQLSGRGAKDQGVRLKPHPPIRLGIKSRKKLGGIKYDYFVTVIKPVCQT